MNLQKIINIHEAQTTKREVEEKEAISRRAAEDAERNRLMAMRLEQVMEAVVKPVVLEGMRQLHAAGHNVQIEEKRTQHPAFPLNRLTYAVILELRGKQGASLYCVFEYGCDLRTYAVSAFERINDDAGYLPDGKNMPLETLTKEGVERHFELFVEHALSGKP